MPIQRSFLIVVNPTAGHGRGRRTANELAGRLREGQNVVTVRETTCSGDARRITRDAVGSRNHHLDCIVACGGDGTIQEVAGALASLDPSDGNVRVSMGLAPAGRCNDFARALHIPTSPKTMADILTQGEKIPIDLGRVNDHHFCTVVTIGVDAAVSSYVDSMRLPLTGTIAYLYGACRVLAHYRPPLLRIEGDFGAIHQRAFLASGANTSSYGGAIPIAPDADPTDGRLDFCLIDPVSRLRSIVLVMSVLRGRHAREPEVHFNTTQRLTIDSEEPLTLWADGERVGCSPATISVVPGAITVWCPTGRHQDRVS